MQAVHSRALFMTSTGYSLSSSLCWDSFACPHCLLSIQPQPRSGAKHENAQGGNCFGDGENTEDANNKQTDGKDTEGDLIKGTSLFWSSLGRYGNRAKQSHSWRRTRGSFQVRHWGQYRQKGLKSRLQKGKWRIYTEQRKGKQSYLLGINQCLKRSAGLPGMEKSRVSFLSDYYCEIAGVSTFTGPLNPTPWVCCLSS